MLKTISPIIALILVFSCVGLSLHSYKAPSYADEAKAAKSADALDADALEAKALPSEKTGGEGLGSTSLGSYTDPSSYADGTYTGSATGYKGKITVEVTVKGGKIYSIRIVSESDDAAWFSKAKKVINRIIKAQSTNVDTVSGATYSSVGIIKAVRNALKKASKKVKSTTEATEATTETTNTSEATDPTSTSSEGNNSSLVEGSQIVVNGNSYTATVWCNPDEYNDFKSYKAGITSTILVVNGVAQVSKVSVTDFKGTTNDRSYMDFAIKRINLKMPVTSADDISVVSSATCSSYSIIAACRASILKALENYSASGN